MAIKRSVETKIQHWLKYSDKALLIEGARQVGKTYIIKKVLEDNGIPFFEINFLERPDLKNIFESTDSVEEIIGKLQLLSPVDLKKKESVIFLDEIQRSPDILTKIKFLVIEGSFKYIMSGSLLGIELKGIKSIPVGYMDVIRMYPLSFKEFIEAAGVKESTIEHIENCFKSKDKVNEVIHKSMMNLFNTYLVVGGMPSVVNEFLKSKNLVNIVEESKSIINAYKLDFSQYEKEDKKLKIISIYDNIPSQLNKQNLRFSFVYLNKELKFDRYENSFLWLKEAGVAYPIYNVTNIESPLVMSKEKNTFKLFLSDVGLLTSSYPVSVQKDIIAESESSYNLGALYENFVCSELIQNGLTPYYFKNSKIGEIDFLVEIDSELVALEIKSGKDFTLHKALNNLHREKPNVKRFVLYKGNTLIDDVIYYPIYMIGLLKNSEIPNINIELNIENI